MDEEAPKKPSKHMCLTNRRPLGITQDPEQEAFAALADEDVLAMVRGLSESEIRSPLTGGAFGLDEQATGSAMRKMKAAGLISSRRDGDDHVYFLNGPRFKDLAKFLERCVKERRWRAPHP